ncbi:MAG: hypothetical protein LQ351_007811 [Letrouitia transgressa]|nr:MAG: hypothetical protein LQ351_007811 [Letrouitia transgressa]
MSWKPSTGRSHVGIPIPFTLLPHHLNLHPRAIFSSNVVTITISPTRTPFKVHEGLLLKHSEHFRNLVVGGRAQAHLRQKIYLADETPQTFRLVNFWLYTGILTDDEDPEAPTPNPEELLGPSWNELVDVYIFAERKLMPALQDACIELFIRRIIKSTTFPQQILGRVWQHTSDGSTMQQLIFDLLTRCFHISEWIETTKRFGGLNTNFLIDLISMYSAIKFGRKPESINFWEERAVYMVSKDEGNETEEEQEDEPGLFVTPGEDDESEAEEQPQALAGGSDSEVSVKSET